MRSYISYEGAARIISYVAIERYELGVDPLYRTKIHLHIKMWFYVKSIFAELQFVKNG